MNKISRHPLLVGGTVLSLAVGALYGCKDFLSSNSTPQGTLDQNTLATRAGVEGSLIAAYRALDWNNGVGGNWGDAASNWVWGSVASDEAYKGSEASDQPPINDIMNYHWSTPDAEGYLNDKWRGMYEGIARANATLRLLKEVRDTKPGEISDELAKGIEGEAKFLRAHYHFEAWRMWGNIPYYREDDTDFRKANLTSDEVITEILKDLDEAIADLEPTPRNGETARASQWTAKAYRGRVLAYAKQWPEALTQLREVANSGPYDLETSFDHVWTGFAEFANGKETIWAYQASANDGEPNGNNANYGERLNFPHSGSPLGCCGFHQPSFNLANFFIVDAQGLPLAVTDPTAWNARNSLTDSTKWELDATVTKTVAVDPRLDWTVGRDGVPYKDWGVHNKDWIRSLAFGGPYSPKKNVHENASGAQSSVGWVNTQLNSVNIHLFRYADLLLMLAEAEIEAGGAGGNAAALAIVNRIRTRASKSAQGCGVPTDATLKALADAEVAMYPLCAPGGARDTRIAVPINDPVTAQWAIYRVGTYPSFPDANYARNAVRAERRIELAMEGQRLFDLRRWGIAEQVINAYLAVEKTKMLLSLPAAEAYAAKHNLYPIPQIQIELSKEGGTAKLTQNTGW